MNYSGPRRHGGRRGGGSGAANSQSSGICFQWRDTGTCSHGRNCKFRHVGPGQATSASSKQKIKRKPQEMVTLIKSLSVTNPKTLGRAIMDAYSLWCKCWENYKLLDAKCLKLMVEVLAKIPGSSSADPPPIHLCNVVLRHFVNQETSNQKSPDQILTAVETIENVVIRLLLFEWESDGESVKDGISDVLLAAESCLRKQNKDHRVASKRIMEKVEDLEKPWRIKMKGLTFSDGSSDDNDDTKPASYSDWQSATVRWLSNPKYFTPSSLPSMKVPKSPSAGLYDSAEDYMETLHSLWVGMTFADGFAALAPHCRSRTSSGNSCQCALYPLVDMNESSTKLRCRTRSCSGLVEFVCRMKGHDAVCGSCATRAMENNMGRAGPKASTHIYDATTKHSDPDGRLHISCFRSRNPPQHSIHWRSTKRLSAPNLVGIVKLKSKGSPLEYSDRIRWGEICCHGKPQDEASKRQRGDLCVDMGSIVDFDDIFPEGSHVAIIDCMTFVPEWIPVLHALEIQKQVMLPFGNGEHLNLCKDTPAGITNSVVHGTTPEEVFASDLSILIKGMIDESMLEPICEIRRDSRLRQILQSSMEQLVHETGLDMMQLISFLDSFRNAVHLTQGPPGTGKSYLGVVIVRALIVIRDLWCRKSKTIGTPPILVLSYKNHAIDEFLVDLVRAEPSGSLSNKLIRIGGQCRDQRLVRYSERNAYHADVEVNQLKNELGTLHQVRDSIRVLVETCFPSILAFRVDIFGDHEGAPDDVNRIRCNAANSATALLMDSLVRKEFLRALISDNDSEDKAPRRKDVVSRLDFLLLDSEQRSCDKLKNQVNQDGKKNRSLIATLDEGVAHYNLSHWGDILLKWISGTVPLPLCIYQSQDGTKCSRLCTSPEHELCDIHCCSFLNCDKPCSSEKTRYCSYHGCQAEGCNHAILESKQIYCKDHCCVRCVQLDLSSGLAIDDPPKNVCEEHPMCLSPTCLEYCSGDAPYCVEHSFVKCMAMTKKKKPCKSMGISPQVPYCRDHLHIAPKTITNVTGDGLGVREDEVTGTQASVARRCIATNRRGKPCKGQPLKGSQYCYDHSFQSAQFVASTASVASQNEQPKAESVLTVQELLTSSGSTLGVTTEAQETVSVEQVGHGETEFKDDASTESEGAAVVDSEIATGIDADEISIDDEEGETLQHLRDVFEVRGADDSDADSSSDGEFFDAKDTEGAEFLRDSDDNSENVSSDSTSWTWKMTLEERWGEIEIVMREQRRLLEVALNFTRTAIFSKRNDLKKAKIRAKARMYENRSVIGGTMVGCISRLESIRSSRPFAVVVEEASEVLEPLLFSCLCESTMKLEMIGDHRQLQPSVMSRFDFEILNKINISMFQRLIEAPTGHEVPSTVLSVQRRMRKNICDLTREYYKDVVSIEDHETCSVKTIGQNSTSGSKALVNKMSTKGREIPGVAPHIYLWTHSGKQGKARVGLSRENGTEATMACGLASYLVNCGVPRTSIAILTPYKGQLMLIRNVLLKDKNFMKQRLISRDPQAADVVRVSTVDRFQGDEEDIVICSLVVDEKSKTGFVKLVNRMIVLLSRARLGLYIIGNVGYFDSNGIPSHWRSTLELLQQNAKMDGTAEGDKDSKEFYIGSQIGNDLPLCCPVHRHVTRMAPNSACLKLGFCHEICQELLSCGHSCSLPCHWPSLQHNQVCSVQLDSPCHRHTGYISCYAASQHSPKTPSGADHNAFLANYMCPEQVDLVLPCGHHVQLACWEDAEIASGSRPYPECKKPSPTPYVYANCQHAVDVKCYELERWTASPSQAPKCRRKVTHEPPCGHSKQMECWRHQQYLDGQILYQCNADEKVELPRCGHSKTMPCVMAQKLLSWNGTKCDEVSRVVEGVAYGPKDATCRELVTFVHSCGHEIKLSCEDAFQRSNSGLPCTQMVETFSRICGHRCKLSCVDVRSLKNVPIPPAVTEYIEGKMRPIDPNHPIVKCKQNVKLKRRCGHFEDIQCLRAGRPLEKCKAKEVARSALCGHSLSLPCFTKSVSIWPSDAFAAICQNEELPQDAASIADIRRISPEISSTFAACQRGITWQRDCGHKTIVKCSNLFKILQNRHRINGCDEQTFVELPCGHQMVVTCREKHSVERGEKTLQCTKGVNKKCWNNEWCGRTLKAICGYGGLVGCRESSSWTCPEGTHSFEIKQCENGRPLTCPLCALNSVEKSAATDVAQDVAVQLPRCFQEGSHDGCNLLSPKRISQFQIRKERMIQSHIDYLKSIALWDRPVTKVQLVPCFRVLQGDRKDSDWFNPRWFAKSRTLTGILTKVLSRSNLMALARKIDQTKKVVLLVGCAAVAKTKLFKGSSIPHKPQKVQPLLQEMAKHGFDSLSYTDEEKFDNLIVFDPFPLIAVVRVTLSTADLMEMSEQLRLTRKTDFTTATVEYQRPTEQILPCDPTGACILSGPDDDSIETLSQDGNTDLRDRLKGTAIEGMWIHTEQLPVDEIGFGGLIPSNIERDLIKKLQFTNQDAPPFIGIEMIKNLAGTTDVPLVDLLLAAEYYQHDTKRSKRHLDSYIEKVREAKEGLHPWTLLMTSRFDKLHAKSLILLFMEHFPTQAKLLSEDDQAKVDDDDASSVDDAPRLNQVLQQWNQVKEQFEIESEATDKLMGLTGLKKVKEEAIRIWKSAMQLQRMEDEVRKQNTFTSNYCFVGNPGSGKTTVARLFAEILCDSKVRDNSTIVEVTAQAAKDNGPDKFRSKIGQAMGGVLFLDEAHDLDPCGDFKGKPIVNELLTLCENERDRISVILAGYEDDLQKKFFAYNDGLKSRFKEVAFDDFDDVELSKIWTDMRTSKKWKEDPNVCTVVVKRMIKMSGRKGFGNAREVRRRLESATMSAMARLGDSFSQDSMKIEVVDVIGEDPRLSSEKLKRILDEVNNKIGWGRIKETINELVKICGLNYERELLGQATLPIFLNRLFIGNPGVGKTSCAKIYGRLLRELGFLSNGDVVSKTSSDFIGSVIGESQNRTTQILEGALGKVLIVDEAYALNDSHFGKQVLDTIVEKVQGGPSDDMAVLLLGYEEQMVQMLRDQNPGLARRFPIEYSFHFDDFSESELLAILKGRLKSDDLECSVEFMEKAMGIFRIQRQQSNFGNAGAVDLLVKGALQKASQRVSGSKERLKLHADDIDDPGSSRAEKDEDPLKRIQKLFRMEKVLEKLERMKKSWLVSQREGDETPNLGHFVFLGSPGTGKTTVARAIADVLFGLGLLPSNKIKETSALELTGDYVGQTKTKVNEALKDAKGGVLFIDEAYNLGFGHYGMEACDTLVAGMTSESFQDVVIVIAGYPQEIDEMLDRNVGLKSRFTHFFHFPDWEPGDCSEFLQLQASKENFVIDQVALEQFERGCASLKLLSGWGNGRDVKKLWDEAKNHRATRVYATNELTRSIQLGDLQQALSAMTAARQSKSTSSSTTSSRPMAYPGETAFQDSSTNTSNPSFSSNTKEELRVDKVEQEDCVDDGTNEGDTTGAAKNTEATRDDGVVDEVWEELQLAKERERIHLEELERKKAELEALIEEQRAAAEEEKRRLEFETERIRKELELQEQEKALQAAQEAEARRKYEAELKRKRLEEEQRRMQKELEKKERIREKLQQLRPCPMGYNWSKVGGGWRCGGGSHFVSDRELSRHFTD